MAIDIGGDAINRDSITTAGYTYVDRTNPANNSGKITSFELWAKSGLTGCKVGVCSGSGTSYDDRDYETIGSVTAGSKQTFSGLDIDVVAGDYTMYYASTGTLERSTFDHSGVYYCKNDRFGAGAATFTRLSTESALSAYATGISAAAVTTNSPTSIAATSLTANGNITDTGGSGSDVTRRGFCYMEGTSGDPTTANSTAYDDGTFGAGAYTKSITGLSPNTSYRIRAYAVNAAGTAYGTTVDATTDASGTLYLTAIMSHKFIPPFLGGIN
jgi:hypothetical protein